MKQCSDTQITNIVIFLTGQCRYLEPGWLTHIVIYQKFPVRFNLDVGGVQLIFRKLILWPN